jgi:hypothetical protein
VPLTRCVSDQRVFSLSPVPGSTRRSTPSGCPGPLPRTRR